MQNIHEIAAASPRMESLHFGVADYAASTRARTTSIGGPNPLYGVLTDKDGDRPREYFWGDMWHYAIRSEEHTSELQSLMRISYAVFCLKKKNIELFRYQSSRKCNSLPSHTRMTLLIICI